MRAGQSKNKGSAFEREVSRKLSLWLSKGRRDDLLWRSAMSGGLATLQLDKDKVNLAQSGDISAIGSEAYEFIEKTFIECKHYKDLQIGRSVLCGTGGLFNFWKIARKEAAKYEKRPLLIVRQNRWPTIALVNAHDPLVLIWKATPLLVIYHWKPSIHVYLFDDVVRVRRERGN